MSELLSEIISHNNSYADIFNTDALSLLYDIISLLKVSIDGKIHKLEIVSHRFLFIKLFVRGCFWLSLHSFFLQTIYSFNFQRIKCYLKLLATITVIADIFNTVLQCTLTEYICLRWLLNQLVIIGHSFWVYIQITSSHSPWHTCNLL